MHRSRKGGGVRGSIPPANSNFFKLPKISLGLIGKLK